MSDYNSLLRVSKIIVLDAACVQEETLTAQPQVAKKTFQCCGRASFLSAAPFRTAAARPRLRDSVVAHDRTASARRLQTALGQAQIALAQFDSEGFVQLERRSEAMSAKMGKARCHILPRREFALTRSAR
ncbi:hypothetical protein [Bradyrhizobium sp. NBAIM08]|uniref:hypothetical protein n=1 Tax=Bradyrhizobium sp. NBAIM08 TaxID=2793815 RepID=UPI001CD80C99|nr:hypothetical protein [Bradyrhizobium sp. NBAIM08]MCA1477094.1 hypothetical protein [Bradyrhizobium sp. NBAIM08]